MTDDVANKRATANASLTSDIVAAYVAHNPVPRCDLAALIVEIHATIERLGRNVPREVEDKLKPFVPLKRSVMPDHIVCLEEVKKFKSLKRHLGAQFGLTPDEYRAKWRLPSTYPMVDAR